MLTWTEDTDDGVIEFTIDGAIDRESIDGLLAACARQIERHGSVRLLKIVERVGTISPAALWDDLRFLYHHMGDVERVAAVGGEEWMRKLGSLMAPLVPCETRMFPPGRLDEARAWLRD